MLQLEERDFVAAAFTLECEVAAVKSVCEVEAPHGGFVDGQPVTLFEGHIFHKYTKGRFDAQAPTLSYPTWTTEFYGHDQRAEKLRLMKAGLLDGAAALMSTSWGRFQIMGFNFALCGFMDVQSFVKAMKESEKAQLDAFVQYILHTRLNDELQDRRWDDFARCYNGPQYMKNRYAEKLAAAYTKWSNFTSGNT